MHVELQTFLFGSLRYIKLKFTVGGQYQTAFKKVNELLGYYSDEQRECLIGRCAQ